MPINTNLNEVIEQGTGSKSLKIVTDAVEENDTSAEVDKLNSTDGISIEPVTEHCPFSIQGSQVKNSKSKLSIDSNKGVKSNCGKLIAGSVVRTPLQQQVSEKLKALSEKLKTTRSQHFNSKPSMKHQQPTSTSVQCALIATNLKSMSSNVNAVKNERVIKEKMEEQLVEFLSVKLPNNKSSRQEPELKSCRAGTSSATANAVKSGKFIKEKMEEELVEFLPCKLPKKSSRQETELKSRQQMEAEITALQNLLGQLSLENPELRMRIVSIAQSMPELEKMDIVKLSRLESGLDNDDGQRPSTSKGFSIANSLQINKRPHLESVGQQSGDGISEGNELVETRPRKRGKRGEKKRKNSTKQKCQVGELRDLSKYINQIVDDYLSKNETLAATVRDNLEEFDGSFDDLEAYAGQLVKFGLGRIVEDELRVNRKNNRQSYVTMSKDREALERDGMVMLPVARRYAFEGDIVRAFVLNASLSTDNGNEKTADKSKATIKDTEEICTDNSVLYDCSDSPDSDLDSNELLDTTGPTMALNCPKAFVIEIIKHTDDRKAVGSISFKHTTKLSSSNGKLYYKFKPLDTRMPLMYVPEDVGALHAESAKSQNELTDLLYLAQVCETDANGHCIAELLEKVGKVGHLEHELKAILLHNGFKDLKPFEQRFEDLYADAGLPILTEEQKKQREDLRKKCIFTIDPPTARDLDDALSIEKISEDEYEVGVHIADVAYFLEEGSELDDIVKTRATSIYLVNEVIHMLPVALCYKCSLIPGEDKLAFSVFWRMNRAGNVLGSPRFTRSIINSCTKFAYGHAQKFIENPLMSINEGFEDFPDIYNGFTLPMIAERIKILQEIAQNMRHKRFENGALSINNPKLRFELDPITGEPMSYGIDKQQEANHLIEEFMLLANMSVARHIYERFPDVSLLRNHEPPLMTSLKNLQEKLLNFGINLDCSSSKAIYNSMQRICEEAKDTTAMNACLSTLLTKPMARAKYICSEDKTTAYLWHYALSIPIYTHFTSPIRRYPDILVHRLLAASLGYCPKPQRTPDELSELANICNVQKFNAKSAGDESALLYFKRYVKAKQGLTMRAAVLEIYKHLVNVVTVQTGHVLPIQYKIQKVIVDTSNVPTSIQISEKGSRQAPIKLQMFSSVDIKLVIRDEKLVAFFVSPDLKQRQINCIELTKNNPVQKTKATGKNTQQVPVPVPRQDHRQKATKQKSKQENTERSTQSQLSETQLHKREQETIVSQIFEQKQRTKKSRGQHRDHPIEQQKH